MNPADFALDELRELERLEKEATPAPWRAESDTASHEETLHGVPQEFYDPDGTVAFTFVGSSCYDYPEKQTRANYQAIAALRNAAPRLLAAARELHELKSALEFLPQGWACAARLDEEREVEAYDAYWVDKDANEEHSFSARTYAAAVIGLARELGWSPSNGGTDG